MDEPLDFAQVCKDIEDHLVPYLRLGSGERAMYYHLLRHSRAEGKRVLQISKRVLARNVGTSATTVHGHLRALEQKGCVKIVERNLAGHSIEVLTPAEIPGCVRAGMAAEVVAVEGADCFKNERLRAAILRREQNACFYCLRPMATGAAVFDHVVASAQGGDNTVRNIVACCFECNSRKGEKSAEEFLRELYRASRLSDAELDARLAALETLQGGKAKMENGK
ncbi:MAG: HNH endonuclease [Acidobacteria bacterium]|nr:HNH endonuclease [Acidobacteriota bacterium]MCL5287763.1 HNH endonuclease [Acidobacteriota bacterium]